MAKVVYGMLTSLDGYVAASDGSLVLPVPEAPLHQYFNDTMKRTSLALYGRQMYEVMRVWDTWAARQEATPVEIDFAHAWQNTPKIVFSSTLEAVGPNARVERGNVEAVVRSIKSSFDGEISVSGPSIAAHLSRSGLIDEYRLFIHPIVLGAGKPFFAGQARLQLRLTATERLPQGVLGLFYAPP